MWDEHGWWRVEASGIARVEFELVEACSSTHSDISMCRFASTLHVILVFSGRLNLRRLWQKPFSAYRSICLCAFAHGMRAFLCTRLGWWLMSDEIRWNELNKHQTFNKIAESRCQNEGKLCSRLSKVMDDLVNDGRVAGDGCLDAWRAWQTDGWWSSIATVRGDGWSTLPRDWQKKKKYLEREWAKENHTPSSDGKYLWVDWEK